MVSSVILTFALHTRHQKDLVWFDLAGSSTLQSYSSNGIEERTGRKKKVKKFMVWDKGSLRGQKMNYYYFIIITIIVIIIIIIIIMIDTNRLMSWYFCVHIERQKRWWWLIGKCWTSALCMWYRISSGYCLRFGCDRVICFFLVAAMVLCFIFTQLQNSLGMNGPYRSHNSNPPAMGKDTFH